MDQSIDRETSDQLLLDFRENSQAASQQNQSNENVLLPDVQHPHGISNTKLSLRNRPVPKRLSFLLQFSVILSVLSIAGVVAVVFWLWWTPNENVRWRRWVLVPNRLQLTVTLAAVTVRTAVGILATLATAMIASVAAEKRGVYLPDVAQVSIARFSNNGPLSLGLLALRGPSLETPIRLVVALLVLTTFATQFTSTLLVSDLEQSRVPSFPRSVSNLYTYIPSKVHNTFSEATDTGTWYYYWLQRPRSSETFAEYSEPAVDGEGFDDTGTTVRSLLPVALQDARESVLGFRGMMRVIDSKVVCMRPKLSDLSPCTIQGTEVDSICGSVQLDDSVDAVAAGLDWPASVSENFSCPLTGFITPGTESGGLPYFWHICGSLRSGYPGIKWSLANNSMLSTTWVIWDGGRAPTSYLPMKTNWTIMLLNTTQSGPWTQPTFRFTYPGRRNVTRQDDITFKMTLCSTFPSSNNGSIRYLNISATSTSNRTEPSFEWDVNKNVFNTSAVRRQLGAVKDAVSMSHQDRQIMSISRNSFATTAAEALDGLAWQKYVIEDEYNFGDWVEDRIYRHTLRVRPMGLCLYCLSWDPSSPNSNADIVYTRLFMDTLDETGSPARAFQALYFMLARNIYYSYATTFSPNTATPDTSTAEVVQSELVLVPRHYRGFWAVMSTLVIFLATFAVTAALFRPTRFSLPENAWHTIAQISNGPEIISVLRKSKVATDTDVKLIIRGDIKPPLDSTNSRLKGLLETLRYIMVDFASFFSFRPIKQTSRFAVREGVFVRTSGVEANIELERNESRRRLTRQSRRYSEEI